MITSHSKMWEEASTSTAIRSNEWVHLKDSSEGLTCLFAEDARFLGSDSSQFWLMEQPFPSTSPSCDVNADSELIIPAPLLPLDFKTMASSVCQSDVLHRSKICLPPIRTKLVKKSLQPLAEKLSRTSTNRRRGRNPLALKPVAERSTPYSVEERQERLERFKRKKLLGRHGGKAGSQPCPPTGVTSPAPLLHISPAAMLGDLDAVQSRVSTCPSPSLRSAALSFLCLIRQASASSATMGTTIAKTVDSATSGASPVAVPSCRTCKDSCGNVQPGGVTGVADNGGSIFSDIVEWSKRIKEELKGSNERATGGRPWEAVMQGCCEGESAGGDGGGRSFLECSQEGEQASSGKFPRAFSVESSSSLPPVVTGDWNGMEIEFETEAEAGVGALEELPGPGLFLACPVLGTLESSVVDGLEFTGDSSFPTPWEDSLKVQSCFVGDGVTVEALAAGEAFLKIQVKDEILGDLGGQEDKSRFSSKNEEGICGYPKVGWVSVKRENDCHEMLDTNSQGVLQPSLTETTVSSVNSIDNRCTRSTSVQQSTADAPQKVESGEKSEAIFSSTEVWSRLRESLHSRGVLLK